MEDDDPFSIVKPERDNKRMSTYLKKQRMNNSNRHCAAGEEASLATTSTRSTTISNRTDDNLFPYSSNSSVISGGSASVSVLSGTSIRSGGSVRSNGSIRSGGSGTGRSSRRAASAFEIRPSSSSVDTSSHTGDDYNDDDDDDNDAAAVDAYGFGTFEDSGVPDDCHAEFGSDFGNALEFGTTAFGSDGFGGGCVGNTGGNVTTRGKNGRSSGRKSSSSGGQGSRKPQSMSDFGAAQRDDGFGIAKPQSLRDFASAGDDGFGTDPFAVDPFGVDDFNQPFEEEPVNFGYDDGAVEFDNAFFSGDNDDDEGRRKNRSFRLSGDEGARKREEWKAVARTQSSCSGKPSDRHSSSRRQLGEPRRYHSADGYDLNPSSFHNDNVRSRNPSSAGTESGGTMDIKRQVPTRARSGRSSRRASMDTSGHLGGGSFHSSQTDSSDTSRASSKLARLRRSSMGYTQPEERSQDVRPPTAPQRQKSGTDSSLFGHIPPGSRRGGTRPHRNTSFSSDHIGSFGEANSFGDSTARTSSCSSSGSGSGTDDKWSRDRNRNQEMIMTQLKDGSSKKSEHDQRPKSSSSLLNDMDADFGSLAVHDGEEDGDLRSSTRGLGKMLKNTFASNSSSGQFGTSIGDGVDLMPSAATDLVGLAAAAAAAGESKRSDRKKGLSSFRLTKSNKKEEAEEEKKTAETRNMMGRSRGTLLERVGAVDGSTTSSSAGGGMTGGGSSYSDRILMQQQRGRR